MGLGTALGVIGIGFGIFEGLNLALSGVGALSRKSSPPDPNALPYRSLIVVRVDENGTNLDETLHKLQGQSAYRTLPHYFNIVFNVQPGVRYIATDPQLTSIPTMNEKNVKPLISISQGLSLKSAIDQALQGHRIIMIVDAKAELQQHWLGNHFRHYDDPEVIAVSGPVLSQPGLASLVEGYAGLVRRPNLRNLSFRSVFWEIQRSLDNPPEVFRALRELGQVRWDQGVGFRLSNGAPTSTSSPSADLRRQVGEVVDLLESATCLDDSTMLSYTRRLHGVLRRIES